MSYTKRAGSSFCHTFHCLALSLIVFTLGTTTIKRWGSTLASPTRIHYSAFKFSYVLSTAHPFSYGEPLFLADFPHFSYSPCWKSNRGTHTSFYILFLLLFFHKIEFKYTWFIPFFAIIYCRCFEWVQLFHPPASWSSVLWRYKG